MKLYAVLVFALTVAAASANVSTKLRRQLHMQGSADVIVTMAARTSSLLAQIKTKSFASRGERLTTVANTLKTHAARTQRSLQVFLAKQKVEFKSFWINNKVFIKHASEELVLKIAARSDVQYVNENRQYGLITPVAVSAGQERPKNLEWGLEMIEVQRVWDAGYNGTGIRVGGLDTGARHTHEALRDNFAKDYNWFDAVEFTPTPADPHGHGSHITGTIAGSHGIGVAPGSEWVHCRGLNLYGSGTEDIFLACAEWFSCPTLPHGGSPDCTKAPSLVSNSWGVWGGGNDFMDSAIQAWLAGNIIPIFANGNEGPTCGILRSPGDSVVPLIAVGSTDSTDSISSFSSFGPSYAGHVKPNIAAPGSDVLSASGSSDTQYVSMSGTSMATPHVAGVVALILNKNPEFQFEEITERLYQSATHTVVQTGRNCGGISESAYPNNHVGWGRLSAAGAVLGK